MTNISRFFFLGTKKLQGGDKKCPTAHAPDMVIFCKVIIFCLFETQTNWLKYMNTCLGSCTLERKTVAFSCQRQLQQPDIQSALAHGNFCPWQLAYGRNLPRAVCSTPNFPTRSFSSHPSLWTDELHSTCRSVILYASVINSSFSEVLVFLRLWSMEWF